MDRFRRVFSQRHVLLPVVHVTELEQALRNAQIARDAGADGVFLINHGMTDDELLWIHAQVVTVFPEWWVGVNCLGLSPQEVFTHVACKVAGVWVDNALIHEDQASQPAAEQVMAVQQQYKWQGLYFGGVAFKYQRPVADLARAAKIAARYMDVVTTSGPGTGRAASPEKIRIMKEALGEAPLAIASGITPENVIDYLPWADCFLVATGISRTFEELAPERVQELVDRIRAYRPI